MTDAPRGAAPERTAEKPVNEVASNRDTFDTLQLWKESASFPVNKTPVEVPNLTITGLFPGAHNNSSRGQQHLASMGGEPERSADGKRLNRPAEMPPGENGPRGANSKAQPEKTMSDYMADARKKLGLKEGSSNAEMTEAIKRQITRLGDDSYAVRENATGKLKELGPAAVREVAKAFVESKDAEVRRRAGNILSYNSNFDTFKAWQMDINLNNLSKAGNNYEKELRRNMLQEPTQRIESSDIARAKVVKNGLDLARQDLGAKADRPLKEFFNRVAEPERLQSLPLKIGVQRIFNARDLAADNKPKEALKQLDWAMSDNLKRVSDHAGFYDAAAEALNKLQPTEPGTVNAWMKTAKAAGIDMEFLAKRGGPKLR